METLEGNRLIAEFMGLVKKQNIYFNIEDGHSWHNENDLEYHLSWDWLMPVVEKIESIPVKWAKSPFKEDGWTKMEKKDHWYEVKIEGNSCDVWESMAMVDIRVISLPHNDPYFKFPDKGKIYAVWLTMVEFIEWYNSKNKSNG